MTVLNISHYTNAAQTPHTLCDNRPDGGQSATVWPTNVLLAAAAAAAVSAVAVPAEIVQLLPQQEHKHEVLDRAR